MHVEGDGGGVQEVVESEGNPVDRQIKVKKQLRQGGRLQGMGEGRERQTCSKTERQRGNEAGVWPQAAGIVVVT